jgi:outer membrane protein assembly factor BamB
MPSRRSLLRTGGVVGVGALAGCTAPSLDDVGPGRSFSAPLPDDDEWPTTRRGPANTACAPTARPPRASPRVVWRSPPGRSVHDLLVAGDTVYATHPTETAALDAATGDRRWTTAGHGQAMVPASSRLGCLADGTLYTVDSERLRAFDAATGRKRWGRVTTDTTLDPQKNYGLQPTDDAVILGFHGGVAGFDAENGRARWRLSPGGFGWEYPAVAHGRLYIGSPGPLYAYDRASTLGRFVDPTPGVRWRGRGPVFCTWPAATEDRLVVADKEWSQTATETVLWVFRRDGTLDWQLPVSGAGRPPAVTPGGTVVVAAGEEPSTVAAVALDPADSDDGTVRWRRGLAWFVRDPVVAGDVVLVAGAPDEHADATVVYALDVDTGETLWTLDIDGDGAVTRLAAVGARVYVGTDAGRVVALG